MHWTKQITCSSHTHNTHQCHVENLWVWSHDLKEVADFSALTHSWTQPLTHTQSCAHTHAHTQMNAHTHIHTREDTCAHWHTHTHSWKHTHAPHTRTLTHTQSWKHTYTPHTHTHTEAHGSIHRELWEKTPINPPLTWCHAVFCACRWWLRQEWEGKQQCRTRPLPPSHWCYLHEKITWWMNPKYNYCLGKGYALRQHKILLPPPPHHHPSVHFQTL